MKKAIIVGATSGIGKGLAKLLADDEYKVGITGRRTNLLTELKNENPGRYIIKSFDITDTNIISGSVYDQFNLPTKNALIYITVAGSSFLSTITSENGSWVLPISEARTQNLENFTVIDEYNTLIEIFVQAGPLGNTSAQIYPVSAKPVPPIILGQMHNFKTINSMEEQSPKAEINFPDSLKNPTFLINR